MRVSGVLVVLLLASTAPGTVGGSQRTVVRGIVVANPLAVVIDVPDHAVPAGTWARVGARVCNRAADPLDDVITELLAPRAVVTVGAGRERTRRVPRQTRTNWRVCAEAAGSYVVMAEATARLGALVLESSSDGRVIEVVGGGACTVGAAQGPGSASTAEP